MKVAVIATVRNERASIDELIDSLLHQSHQPDEIVFADSESDDGTAERLAELATAHPTIQVLNTVGDRSQGRNAAIAAASSKIIACIDGGCVAEPDWLQRLVAPFSDEATTWVAGFYRPVGATLLATCIGLVMVWTPRDVDPDTFLPSARSMAFTKVAWEAVGGFPEGMNFAEDTIFDERMLAAGNQAVFAGDAIVQWTPPPNLRALAATSFRWARGDGQSGNKRFHLRRHTALFLATPIAAILALAFYPLAVPLVVAPVAVLVARNTKTKYGYVTGPLKYLFIPAAYLVNTASAVIGYLVGRLDSR